MKGLTSHDVKCTRLQANEDPEQYNYLPLTLCEKYYLTLRLLMSYIYGAPILDVSRSHTTQHSR